MGGGHGTHRVYDINGHSATLRENHGSVQLILDDRDMRDKVKIGASRGRNPKNTSDRTDGAPTEQHLEINEDDVTNTITSVGKDNLVIQSSIIDDNYPNRTREYVESRTTLHRNCGVFKVNNIRRLTEIECERLQGFPDNHTEYGNYDGVIKKIPSTQRYKMLGNAVSVCCPKIIAERLLKNK